MMIKRHVLMCILPIIAGMAGGCAHDDGLCGGSDFKTLAVMGRVHRVSQDHGSRPKSSHHY